MKYKGILLLHLMVAGVLGAQPVSVVESPEMKAYKHPFQFILGEQGDMIYTIGAKHSYGETKMWHQDVYLREHNSQTMAIKNEFVIDRFKYEGNKTRLLEAYANDEGFHLLYEANIKKEDSRVLLHRQLSSKGEASPVEVIATMDNIDRHGANFKFYTSEDNKGIMVYEEVFEEYNIVRTPKVTLFDQKFNPIWSGGMSSPFPKKLFVPVQMEVSASGELFVMGFAKENDKLSARSARKTPEYGIVRIFKNEAPRYFNFSTKGKVIHSLGINPDYNGKLIVVGYYAEDMDKPVKGSIFGILDQNTLNEERMVIREFESEVFSYFQEDDRSKFEHGLSKALSSVYSPAFEGLDFFSYTDFVDHPSGGVVAIAERRYGSSDIRKWTPGNILYAYYDEVALFYFDEEGHLQWNTVVPKNQILISSKFGSYFAHVASDGIWVVYNDDPENFQNIQNDQPIKSMTENALTGVAMSTMLAKIGWDGTVNYQQMESENNRNFIDFRNAESLNDEIMVGYHGRGQWGGFSIIQIKFP